MDGDNEARVTVNGVPLSVGQVMTIRVALTDVLLRMKNENALGDDEHGRRMARAYHERAAEVLTLMIEGIDQS